jgi:hypothetical protein
MYKKRYNTKKKTHTHKIKNKQKQKQTHRKFNFRADSPFFRKLTMEQKIKQ